MNLKVEGLRSGSEMEVFGIECGFLFSNLRRERDDLAYLLKII